MRLNKDILFVVGFAALAAGVGFNYTYGTKAINTLKTTAPVTAQQEVDIKGFLMENPEAIINSLETFKISMMEQQKKDIEAQVAKNYDKIYSDNSFVIGNPDADIKMVEFFDYNCGYCKQVSSVLTQLAEENPNIQIYLKDTPILGQSSLEAAKAGVAAGLLGKYKEYSAGLMAYEGTLDEKAFRKVATQVGLDSNELIEMTSSERVSEILMDNRMAASLAGLQGTPTIFIETELYQGNFSIEDISRIIRAKMEEKMAAADNAE
jgi:protein-disulfide isomerase